MSHLIVVAAAMHKIGCLTVDVKYRGPGNVVEYIPLEFEVFQDGEFYKAIPTQNFQTRILTDLPDALVFKITKGKIFNYTPGKEEVVEDIVRKLLKMNGVERPDTRFVETGRINSLSPKNERDLPLPVGCGPSIL